MKHLLLILALAMVFPAGAQQYPWQPVTPYPTDKDLYGIHFLNENQGWICGLDGELLKTTDGGAHWMRWNSSASVHLFSVRFRNADTGYATGLNGKLIRTINGGQTWSGIASGTNETLMDIEFFNADSMIMVATGGIALRTVRGTTWLSNSFGAGETPVGLQVFHPRHVYTAGPLNLYKSVSRGQAWRATDFMINTNSYPVSGFHFVDSAHGFAVGDRGLVLKTANGGRSWSSVQTTNPNGPFYRSVWFTSMTDGVVVGDSGLIRHTTDGGLTWTTRSAGTAQQLNKVYFASTTHGWAIGTGGTIVATTDGGQSWHLQSHQSTASGYVDFVTPNKAWAITWANPAVFSSTDNGGKTWLSRDLPPSTLGAWFNRVRCVDEQYGWIVGGGNVLRTADGGISWSRLVGGFGSGGNEPYDIATMGPQIAWYCGEYGAVHKTMDGGRTWTYQSTGLHNGLKRIQFYNDRIGWVGGNYGDFARTTDGGRTWAASAPFGTNFVMDMSFVGPDSGWAVVSGSSGSEIYRTIDSGKTWRSQRSISNRTMRSIYMIDGRTGYAAGDYNAIYKMVNGVSWNLVTDGLLAGVIRFFGPNLGYAGNAGYLQRLGDAPAPPYPPNLASGTVFESRDSNCLQDTTEPGMPQTIVWSEPGFSYGLTDAEGQYSLKLDSGSFTLRQIITSRQSLLVRQQCPDSSRQVTLNGHGLASPNHNFANQVTRCPFLSVSVMANRRRRCFQGFTSIQYCNSGYAGATGAVVHLRLPRYVILDSSSVQPSYYTAADSTYHFIIQSLPAGECGWIEIIDSVSCLAGITGLEQCTKVWITPGNTCIPTPPGHDGSDLTARYECRSGQAWFVLKNKGAAMAAPRPYRVYVDTLLVQADFFQLSAHDSLLITVPLPAGRAGALVRLEADQNPNHPFSQMASAQGRCSSGITRMGDEEIYPQDDESPVVDVDCQPIRDSYDPNDKQVQPRGLGQEGKVLPNTLLEYTIHFQNTGTDTAYTVRVDDTLSTDLDLATLEFGASSHPYMFLLGGKGRPALSFRFDRINLPDSTTNKLRSQGFLTFRIRPRAEALPGTRIQNEASIYFDFNDPVRTNSTLNTLYRPTVTHGITDPVVVAARPVIESRVAVFPNPSRGHFTLRLTTAARIRVANLAGQAVLSRQCPGGDTSLDLSAQGPGVYFLTVSGPVATEVIKLVVE